MPWPRVAFEILPREVLPIAPAFPAGIVDVERKTKCNQCRQQTQYNSRHIALTLVFEFKASGEVHKKGSQWYLWKPCSLWPIVYLFKCNDLPDALH
jgi:hypothetical protein